MARNSSRRVLVTLLAVLACFQPPDSHSTQWAPRDDVGVAAVDGRTGEIVWEAWESGDIPRDSPPPVRAAVLELLAKSEWSPDPDAGYFGCPLQFTENQIVNYAYDAGANQHHLTLVRGTVERPGAELARFSHGSGHAPYRHSGKLLYVVVNGCVHALAPLEGEPPADRVWRPRWTHDLLNPPPGKPRETRRHGPWTLRADDSGLWVSECERIRRLTPAGQLAFEYVFEQPWHHGKWDSFGTPLTVGKQRVYFRHAMGVIALDREKSHEAWRVLTARSPYPSRVVETDGPLVLIQVGSNAPQTLRGVLAEDKRWLPQVAPDSPPQRVAAVALLRSYGDGYLRPAVRRWIERTRQGEPDDDTTRAIARIEALLKEWPAKRDRQRMIDACIAALLAPPDRRGEFGSPAAQRRLTWCLLQEVIHSKTPDGYRRPGTNYAYDCWRENETPLSKEQRRALAQHCRQVIADGPEGERGFAASVLLCRAVGWDSLSDAELTRLFLSPHESVWRWTGMALAKNDRREQLVEWAPRRPQQDHLDVIFMLANEAPQKRCDAEERFWLACARRQPRSIAYVLNLRRPEGVPLAYREPIRAYLAKEIEKPTILVNSQKEYDLVAALRVLHRWRLAEDTPLLLSYLSHPCRQTNGTYSVRQHVRVLLEERGVELPAGIVYQAEPDAGKTKD